MIRVHLADSSELSVLRNGRPVTTPHHHSPSSCFQVLSQRATRTDGDDQLPRPSGEDGCRIDGGLRRARTHPRDMKRTFLVLDQRHFSRARVIDAGGAADVLLQRGDIRIQRTKHRDVPGLKVADYQTSDNHHPQTGGIVTIMFHGKFKICSTRFIPVRRVQARLMKITRKKFLGMTLATVAIPSGFASVSINRHYRILPLDGERYPGGFREFCDRSTFPSVRAAVGALRDPSLPVKIVLVS